MKSRHIKSIIIIFILFSGIVYIIPKILHIKTFPRYSKQKAFIKDYLPRDNKSSFKKGATRNVFSIPKDEEGIVKDKLIGKIETYLRQLEGICIKADSIEGAMFGSREIIQSLNEIGEPAIPFITKSVYEKGNEWKMRFILIGLLSSMKDVEDRKDVINLFSDLAEDSKDKEDVRISAVRGLRWIKAKDSFFLLNEILKRDDEPVGLKMNIITTMSILDEGQSIPILINQIQGAKDWHLQLSAISSLERLNAKDAIPVLINKLKETKKEKTSSGYDINYQEIVRMHIALALGNIGNGNGDVENELIAILGKKNEKIDVRISAAEALGNLESKKSIVPLLEALQEKDGLIRIKVAEALVKIGDKSIVSRIEKHLEKENDDFVKTRIERCLKKFER